jgi:hypothetical protein
MTALRPTTVKDLLSGFEGPWRDDTPVFGCCRKAVAAAVEDVEVHAIASLDATARVRALREAVERRSPGHLSTHRCCAGHLADLAFDLPEMLAPASEG